MQSKATTVEAYLAELPADRRAVVEQVRAVIRANLHSGFEEGIQYGMIGYYVPHRLYPPGYHCDPKQPLPFAGISSQKNYISMYLGCVYGSDAVAEKFKRAWAATGKKLDMGKACIRFKKPEDLALDVIADTIKSISAAGYIAYYESAIKTTRNRPAKAAVKKAAKTSSRRTAKKTAAVRRAAKKRASKTAASGAASKKTRTVSGSDLSTKKAGRRVSLKK